MSIRGHVSARLERSGAHSPGAVSWRPMMAAPGSSADALRNVSSAPSHQLFDLPVRRPLAARRSTLRAAAAPSPDRIRLPDALKLSPERSVAQRVVESVQVKGTTCYRTTFDTRKNSLFATQKEAQDYENAILAGKHKPYLDSGRVPTTFTLMQTEPDRVLASSNQGPHTFAACGTDEAVKRMPADKIDEEFDNGAPSSADVEAMLQHESSNMTGSDVKGRINRAVEYHTALRSNYAAVRAAKPHKHTHAIKKHIFRRMLHFHPYGTYKWNRDNPRSDADWNSCIAGKGERKGAPLHKLVDKNADKHFLRKGRYKAFMAHRRKFIGRYRPGAKKNVKKADEGDSS